MTRRRKRPSARYRVPEDTTPEARIAREYLRGVLDVFMSRDRTDWSPARCLAADLSVSLIRELASSPEDEVLRYIERGRTH